uniref:Uncharacterized protein n=1 Tax=Morchella brunnea TaxID=1174671 RepID=A0A8K1MGC4_9PEZI|nr:hypothetical protein LK370_mgp158 [Morchella brunnea]UBU98373.1 hypothetical protein [Morchella brunnea]
MLFSNADNDRSDSGFEGSSSDEEEVAVTMAVNSVVKYAQEPNPQMNYPGDLPDLKDANLFNTAIIEADDSPSRIKASPLWPPPPLSYFLSIIFILFLWKNIKRGRGVLRGPLRKIIMLSLKNIRIELLDTLK